MLTVGELVVRKEDQKPIMTKSSTRAQPLCRLAHASAGSGRTLLARASRRTGGCAQAGPGEAGPGQTRDTRRPSRRTGGCAQRAARAGGGDVPVTWGATWTTWGDVGG